MIDPNWIEVIRAWAEPNKDVLAVYLFGSRVRGTARSQSDLDVAVLVARGKTLNDTYSTWTFQHEKWEAELQDKLAVKLDLQLGNPELSTTVVGSAIAEYGQLIYERD